MPIATPKYTTLRVPCLPLIKQYLEHELHLTTFEVEPLNDNIPIDAITQNIKSFLKLSTQPLDYKRFNPDDNRLQRFTAFFLLKVKYNQSLSVSSIVELNRVLRYYILDRISQTFLTTEQFGMNENAIIRHYIAKWHLEETHTTDFEDESDYPPDTLFNTLSTACSRLRRRSKQYPAKFKYIQSRQSRLKKA